MWSKTGVTVVKSTFCGDVIVKPMSDNILCISGMTPENIYVVCAQAALFQLCQCLLLNNIIIIIINNWCFLN